MGSEMELDVIVARIPVLRWVVAAVVAVVLRSRVGRKCMLPVACCWAVPSHRPAHRFHPGCSDSLRPSGSLRKNSMASSRSRSRSGSTVIAHRSEAAPPDRSESKTRSLPAKEERDGGPHATRQHTANTNTGPRPEQRATPSADHNIHAATTPHSMSKNRSFVPHRGQRDPAPPLEGTLVRSGTSKRARGAAVLDGYAPAKHRKMTPTRAHALLKVLKASEAPAAVVAPTATPSAVAILESVRRELVATGASVITEFYLAEIGRVLHYLRDGGCSDSCKALETIVQSAHDNCNLLSLHHLRAPHAVIIAGCAVSWCDANERLPQSQSSSSEPAN
jgi:hypothetical protein